MEEQGDLFGRNGNIILAHDEKDEPKQVGYSDLHWWVLNRWAEESIRVMRLLGFI